MNMNMVRGLAAGTLMRNRLEGMAQYDRMELEAVVDAVKGAGGSAPAISLYKELRPPRFAVDNKWDSNSQHVTDARLRRALDRAVDGGNLELDEVGNYKIVTGEQTLAAERLRS